VSNAAANPHFGPLHTPAAEAWAKIIDTNVTASLAMAQCCLPHLTASKVVLDMSCLLVALTIRRRETSSLYHLSLDLHH
jgi:NAD(P)-dependent dehydrogenase (short-subunit alcohol dehydrogenase family)